MGLDREGVSSFVEFDDILQVRAPALCFYVLKANDGLYIIDGGFIGGGFLLARALFRRGWHNIPIRGILITHGHLDHILNVSILAKRTGAWIAAPRLDAAHYEGHYHYSGAARVTGALEAIGRKLFDYHPFHVDRWLEDGTELGVWHGLQAIHLPGHTEGHTGFYSLERKLLFSADLFASFRFGPQRPPAIFNSRPEMIASSVTKALTLELEGVLPNHCDRAPAAKHLARLKRLHQRQGT